jgi:protein ImuB
MLWACLHLSPPAATGNATAGDAAHWRELLAAWAYRYSSQVHVGYEDAVVLEIEASLRLFGPWPAFERRLREDLEALGIACRIAVAPHPRAAWVLAGVHDGLAIVHEARLGTALARIPVARAKLDPKQAQALQAMGLRRLGQLLAAPRDALGKRFGPALLQHLDRLRGAPEALDAYAPPDRFDLRIELEWDVESTQPLLFPLRRLVSALGAFLAGRDGGVQRFVLRLEHDRQGPGGHPDTEVVVGLLAAERDPALLFEIARSRLERLEGTTRHAVPAPVRGLRLVAEELPPFVPAARELFEARPAQSLPWEALRERLRARLGSDAVYRLAAHDDHRPEQAWRRVTVQATAAERTVSRHAVSQPAPPAAPRPAWLLPQPIPLRGHGFVPLAGPERIESGWWDGGGLRRDYYVVETGDGQRAWVFRPAGDADAPPMLHGWFA